MRLLNSVTPHTVICDTDSMRPFPHVELFAMTSDPIRCTHRNIIVIIYIHVNKPRIRRELSSLFPLPLLIESPWIWIILSVTIIHWSYGSLRLASALENDRQQERSEMETISIIYWLDHFKDLRKIFLSKKSLQNPN